MLYAVRNLGRDRLLLYFLVQLLVLPVLRMLPTPAHDGVRLMLPTFFFLAAFAGWGAVWLADGLARATGMRQVWSRTLIAAARSGSGGLAARPGPPVRAVVLQRADRRCPAGLALGLRAVVLVRRLQSAHARRAQCRLPERAEVYLYNPKDETPTSPSSRRWASCGETSTCRSRVSTPSRSPGF